MVGKDLLRGKLVGEMGGAIVGGAGGRSSLALMCELRSALRLGKKLGSCEQREL